MKPRWRDNFFGRRWRGEVALQRLFWRDILVVGTSVNLLASFAALMLAAQHVATMTVVATHFAPLPYNVFLFAALWRMPQRSLGVSLAALTWLVLMTLL